VVRQIAFYSFERAVHSERRNGELTAERLGRSGSRCSTKAWGCHRYQGGLRIVLGLYRHFIHFAVLRLRLRVRGLLGELALCVYESHEGFAERYLAMLRGGTKHHAELLKPLASRPRSSILARRPERDRGDDRGTRGIG